MRIGIDLGGTKIEGIAIDEQGNTLYRTRVETPGGGYVPVMEALVALVGEVEREAGRQGQVGVGMPGAISRASGLVKNANSIWLNGRPFDRDLAAALGREVRVSNDANCFALSEATDGSAADASVVFGVILGTGVGGGIVVNGTLLRGPNSIAGEWGHNPLPWAGGQEVPGAPCYCGKHGCIETFLSGAGLARDYSATTGSAAREVVAMAEQGDAGAERVLQRYEDRLARALAQVINILDPDVIVLGGGLSNIRRLYRNVPRLWHRYVFSDRVDTRLTPARFGDASGVRGAAWLWPA